MTVDASLDRDLVDGLRGRYLGALEAALGGRRRVALLDFPHHENVGDSAIWLGERAALARLGCQVVHVGELSRHDGPGLRRRLGSDGAILLHGGGNLGDLWPQHQAFRERLLGEVADRRVVLLAQSMQFRDSAAARRAAASFDAHPDLVVLARDERTLVQAQSLWRTPTVLCPDAAFLLDLPTSAARDDRVVWLLRSDHETAREQGAIGVDWLHRVSRASPERWAEDLLEAALRTATLLERVTMAPRQLATPAAFDALATRQLRRGTRLLGGAGAVVTDRLHGHILCLLLGVPHVLLPDANGKVRAFHDTWTTSSRLAHWAESLPDADSLSRELAAA